MNKNKNIHRQHNGPGSKMHGEKAKDFKGIMFKLINYSKNYKVMLFIAITLAMLGSILTLLGPDYITSLTDEITNGMSSSILVEQLENNGININNLINSNITIEDLSLIIGKPITELTDMGITIESLKTPGINMNTIYNIGIFLVIIYSLSYIASISQGMIISTIMQKTAKSLRSDIAIKINKLPMKYFSTHSKGDVLSRVTNDVDTVGMSLTQSVGTLVSALTLFIGSIIMMFITNVILTITAILSTILGFIFMMIVMRISQKHFKKRQQYLGELNGHIEEIYTGHSIVKAYNGEEDSINKFNTINSKLKNAAFISQAMSGLMMPMMIFIGNFGYVSVCVVGSVLALNGNISFGIIVAFMIYIRLFTQPLSQMAQAMQLLQSAAAAAERVFEILEESEMPDESHITKQLNNVKGEIEFRNVKFGYDKDKTIIHNFSTKVLAGQKVAIVGPTGAGKTTLVNLLMRFFDIDSGDIYIDGINTKDIKREDVHSKFCMVLQDTWIFEGTLKENLVYSSENVSEEKMEEACRAVGLHHFIKTLHNGYDTVLNDAINLSLGQKQQITIARAMIADKPMLILDEATSSVDTRTEIQIQQAMDQLMSNRTSFVIAHRLSTIKNADVILVVNNGDIVEKGNHKELLKLNGFYADLYNSQFDIQ